MKQFAKHRMKAVLENVPRVIDCVAESARAAGFEEQELYGIKLAVDEACANVVHHAYAGEPPGDMEISCSFDHEMLVIRVRDWGRGFLPENVPEPNIEAPLEDRCLGGLGLFLIKQYMDQVQFKLDPKQGNLLTMTKRLHLG